MLNRMQEQDKLQNLVGDKANSNKVGKTCCALGVFGDKMRRMSDVSTVSMFVIYTRKKTVQ